MRCPARGLLVVLLVAAHGAGAAGTEPAASGFEAAIRSGVIFPTGDALKDTKLTDYVGLAFPIWGDIGYRFGGKYFIGASVLYAFGTLGDLYKGNCSVSGISCSVGGLHVGPEFQFHPVGRAPIDPWIGAGFGYEWSSTRVSGNGGSATVTLQGWNFLQVEGGVDFALGSAFRLGPFVAFFLGQFDKSTVSSSQGASQSFDITNKALHYYFTLGAKVTIVP